MNYLSFMFDNLDAYNKRIGDSWADGNIISFLFAIWLWLGLKIH